MSVRVIIEVTKFKLAIEMAEALLFLSLKYELLSKYRMSNALIDVMSSNDALHSVLLHDLYTPKFNTRNARMRSMVPPSMSKPFLLSTHSLHVFY